MEVHFILRVDRDDVDSIVDLESVGYITAGKIQIFFTLYLQITIWMGSSQPSDFFIFMEFELRFSYSFPNISTNKRAPEKCLNGNTLS